MSRLPVHQLGELVTSQIHRKPELSPNPTAGGPFYHHWLTPGPLPKPHRDRPGVRVRTSGAEPYSPACTKACSRRSMDHCNCHWVIHAGMLMYARTLQSYITGTGYWTTQLPIPIPIPGGGSSECLGAASWYVFRAGGLGTRRCGLQTNGLGSLIE